MQKNTVFKKVIGLIDPAGARKYITQVTLILLSLSIATNVDRCKQAQKEDTKLHEYLNAIQLEIKEEIKICKMNLGDCRQDIRCLGNTLHYCNLQHPDSLRLGVGNYFEVVQRGVFRTFEPTTFEMMAQAGDAHLMKDLALRSHLAKVFAFRNTTIRNDLENFDRAIDDCSRATGPYFDMVALMEGDNTGIHLNKENNAHFNNEIFLLLKAANIRAFHLENAIDDLEKVLKEVESAGGGSDRNKNNL